MFLLFIVSRKQYIPYRLNAIDSRLLKVPNALHSKELICYLA